MQQGTDTAFILKIPIKPYLKGFLHNFYDSPYKLNQSDDIGIFLYHLLRRRDFKGKEFESLELCTDHFEITMPQYMAFNKGCNLINDYQIYIFNNYLELNMMRNCFLYLDGRMMHGSRLKDYVYAWIDDNNLVEGSSDWYHKIKKAYYRYRQKREKKYQKQVNSVSPKKRSHKTTLAPCSVT